MSRIVKSVSRSQIDGFVERVVGWSEVYRECAAAAARRAHDQYLSGEIDLAAYSEVVQSSHEVLRKTVEITNAASQVLLRIAESQTAPIQQATDALAAASKRLDGLEDAVILAAELLSAVTAVAVAFSAPSVASVAAAGAAVGAVAKHLAKPVETGGCDQGGEP